MKSIIVPRIEGLEQMTFDELSQALEYGGTRQAVDCAPWPDQYPYKPIAVFDTAASDTHLFVRFFVRGFGLKALYADDNEPVWQDSCVETFIADRDGRGYRNFEMNCIGTLLSAHQLGRGIETVRLDAAQLSQVIRHTSLERCTFAEKEGIHQWSVAMGIPFTLLGYAAGERPERLRANFYKCADGSARPHYVSWAPIETAKPDFHRPEFFGELILKQL